MILDAIETRVAAYLNAVPLSGVTARAAVADGNRDRPAVVVWSGDAQEDNPLSGNWVVQLMVDVITRVSAGAAQHHALVDAVHDALWVDDIDDQLSTTGIHVFGVQPRRAGRQISEDDYITQFTLPVVCAASTIT